MAVRRTALSLMAAAIAVAATITPTSADTVTPAAAIRLTGPGAAMTGEQVRLLVKAPRSRAGDRVVLKQRESDVWTRVARKRLGERGKAAFAVTVSAAGTHRFRALVLGGGTSNGLSVVVQAPVVVDTTPPPSDTAPPTSTTLPDSVAPPPIVPPLPVLPPYPGGSGAVTFSKARTTSLLEDNLDCANGYVGTRHASGVGNGAEWEVWVPVLWGFNWSTYQWEWLSVGNYHYRDSAPHPFSTSGHAWLIYPSGATNAYAQWYWPVTRGHWYAVQNWDYSASRGWSARWGHIFADSGYPPMCQAF